MRPTRYPRRGTDAVHSALAQTRKAALRLRSFQRMRTRTWLPVKTHTEPTAEQTQVASKYPEHRSKEKTRAWWRKPGGAGTLVSGIP